MKEYFNGWVNIKEVLWIDKIWRRLRIDCVLGFWKFVRINSFVCKLFLIKFFGRYIFCNEVMVLLFGYCFDLEK